MSERLLPGTATDIIEGEGLDRGSVGFATVLFQSMTHIAPAVGLIFALGAAIPYAGAALPLSTVVGFIGVAFVAYSVGQLARVLPASGYYMTWIARAIDHRLGFLVAWMTLLAEGLIPGALFLVLGWTLSAARPDLFGGQQWYLWAFVLAGLILVMTYLGIKISGTAGVVLGLVELVILAVLAIWLIVDAGSANTTSVFTTSAPGVDGGWSGIFRGVIYVVPAFVGFETAAPLAEETRNPRKAIPRAILLATVGIGVFFVVSAYAGIVGWGPNKIAGYASSPNAWQALGSREWGAIGTFLVVFALINSTVGNANAGMNAAARLVYAMARIGTIPRVLARIQPQRRTPHIAIFWLTGANLALAILVGWWRGGPVGGFGFLVALGSIFFMLLYVSACIAVPFLYLRYHRNEFNPIKHIVAPAIGIAVFIGPLKSTVYPVPPYPLNLAPYVDLAWIAIGAAILIYLLRNRPQSVENAAAVMIEADPDEVSERVVRPTDAPRASEI
jgi:amino acid transporter